MIKCKNVDKSRKTASSPCSINVNDNDDDASFDGGLSSEQI